MTVTIGRRELLAALGGAVAAWPLAARAQPPAMPVVGFVSSRSLEGSARHAAAFTKGLSETGYVEGQNVVVEYLSLPEIKSGRIDGAIRPGSAGRECGQQPEHRAKPAHPCSATSVCAPRCNIFDTI
jgi:hypothetical protein